METESNEHYSETESPVVSKTAKSMYTNTNGNGAIVKKYY